MSQQFKQYWSLNPDITFLNHGAFGACPTAVLEYQQQLHLQLEANPMDFLHRTLERRLDEARDALATFLGCQFDGLTFVSNATTGVNAVLQSLDFHAGDHIVVTDHEYNATRNALNYIAEQKRCDITTVHIPYPIQTEQEAIQPVLEAITPKTRLVILDHITSATGFIMPIETIIEHCNKLNILTLIDGAHGPGMLPLQLDKLGATFYTGNCHKWMCTPKGSALLYVRRDFLKDHSGDIHPAIISHGYNSIRTDRSKYLIQFGWTGTLSPTPWLAIPKTIQYLQSLLPGGWDAIRQHNHELMLWGRNHICKTLDLPIPCPDRFQGSMVSIPLPPDPEHRPPNPLRFEAILQNNLWEHYKIEVPIFFLFDLNNRCVRICAQLYNTREDYIKLADALRQELKNGF